MTTSDNPPVVHRYWRAATLLVLGVVEQALLSASTFVFTVVVANAGGAVAFGEFSIAWSLVIFTEAICWAFLGDPIPAIASRIPLGKMPQLRGAMYLVSSFVVASLFLLVATCGVITMLYSESVGALVVLSAVAGLALRLQQLFRRICHLDHRRIISAVGSSLYAGVLLFVTMLLVKNNNVNALTAMCSWASAMGAHALLVLLYHGQFQLPSRRLAKWLLVRLLRSGTPLSLAAVLYWFSSYGLIPLAASLLGVAAGGAVRMGQNLLTPLVQTIAAISTVVVPFAAKYIRYGKAADRRVLLLLASAYGILATMYGGLLIVFGHDVLLTVAGHEMAKFFTRDVLIVVAVGAVADALRTAITAVMLASERTYVILFGWLASSIVAACGVGIVICYSSFLGVVAVTALTNVAGAAALVALFLRSTLGGRRELKSAATSYRRRSK